ncbi:unnamed protein product, partial [Penicillium nalgiovense]
VGQRWYEAAVRNQEQVPHSSRMGSPSVVVHQGQLRTSSEIDLGADAPGSVSVESSVKAGVFVEDNFQTSFGSSHSVSSGEGLSPPLSPVGVVVIFPRRGNR